jgi:hypothetical protein
MAFSALYSCQNEKTALITITAQIAQPSCGSRATKAKIPPTQSRMAIKWVKFPRNLMSKGFLRTSRIELKPNLFRRASTSSRLNPFGPLSSARYTSVTERAWIELRRSVSYGISEVSFIFHGVLRFLYNQSKVMKIPARNTHTTQCTRYVLSVIWRKFQGSREIPFHNSSLFHQEKNQCPPL